MITYQPENRLEEVMMPIRRRVFAHKIGREPTDSEFDAHLFEERKRLDEAAEREVARLEKWAAHQLLMKYSPPEYCI